MQWDDKVKHQQSNLKQLVHATSGRLLLKNSLEGSFDDDAPAPAPGPMLATLDRRRRQLAGGTGSESGLANVDGEEDDNETMPAPLLFLPSPPAPALPTVVSPPVAPLAPWAA